MLDFDLAKLYGVETRSLNQAVKRNIERFPEDFMFQLTKGEFEILKSQIVISKPFERRGGTQKLPYAFTENGVAMLSSVLHSPQAIQVNISIMRVFNQFRHIAGALPQPSEDIRQLRQDFEELKLDIEDILANQNDINEDTRAQLELINQSLAALQTTHKQPRRPIIGFGIPTKDEKND